MPHVITTSDGHNHTVTEAEDIIPIFEEYMGTDASRWLREWVREQRLIVDDAECEAREYKHDMELQEDHQRLVLTDIYEDAEEIIKTLTESERLSKKKRQEMSEAAKRIRDRLHEEL